MGPYNFVSTSDTFICDETKTQPSNWNALGFDDSNWSRATSYGKNGVQPWRTIGNGQSSNAQWIWTDDHQQHNVVYCRLSNNCAGKSAGDKCAKRTWPPPAGQTSSVLPQPLVAVPVLNLPPP